MPEAESFKARVRSDLRSGADVRLVTAGYVGLYGAALIAQKRKKELCAHFYWESVEAASEANRFAEVNKGLIAKLDPAASKVFYISDDGFLSCLWRALSELRLGAQVDMEAVPIKQETVEICEYFSLDPYKIPSVGAALIVSYEADEVCRIMREAKVAASVVGTLDTGNDRILKHRGVKSFLNRPRRALFLI